MKGEKKFLKVFRRETPGLGNLIFMGMAGYDPRSAVDFWQRMDEKQDQASPPEFLSTHPAHETRIEDIRQHLPAAMEYYQGY